MTEATQHSNRCWHFHPRLGARHDALLCGVFGEDFEMESFKASPNHLWGTEIFYSCSFVGNTLTGLQHLHQISWCLCLMNIVSGFKCAGLEMVPHQDWAPFLWKENDWRGHVTDPVDPTSGDCRWSSSHRIIVAVVVVSGIIIVITVGIVVPHTPLEPRVCVPAEICSHCCCDNKHSGIH